MPVPDVHAILAAFRADLARATEPADLDEVRRVHSGKKSAIKDAFRFLRDVSDAERPAVAAALNDTRDQIDAEIDAAAQAITARALDAQLAREWQDLTLPGIAPRRGARHPFTEIEARCAEVLRRLGFSRVDGPEVEHPYYNFDALNIPKHHPARDMQDTFWVGPTADSPPGQMVLRSHTTTVQARVLERQPELPIKVFSAGRVYRNEAVDATHTAMFFQLEGLWVDEDLTFADLKGVLAFVAKSLYGEDRKVRFKPKFYPYTEPSVGVDLSCGQCGGSGCDACHGVGWITILGAGMVHPKVFLEFGYDPEEVSGIAFGLGTTRMAAQFAGVSKAKALNEQDLRVHEALHRQPHRGADRAGGR